ncbi:WecB/TagA/CpsF family glycosyl transferase [Mycobacterium lentiflavum]|uniref:WecB/TagA/CpsF family glycosyl transferase n=1 Tax=Mycobacterium lentiflavum TaxID=141349 RepID=A0A0E4H0W5_MYCLN|nr:WecB/TagA/CpsF family glycosyltransferase [Mycobacterium lentiflavum]CQD20083.1 WecB/TagA/CpsF family glycosyl transferase [Mycobacterium lentiflavum]
MQAFSSSPISILDVIRVEDAGVRPEGGTGVTLPLRETRTDADERNIANDIINSITVVNTDEAADALIDKCLTSRTARIISFVNAHAFNMCNRDGAFADGLLQSDVILRDGIGMQLLFQKLNIDAGLNMNGTDLIPRLLDSAKGQTVGLLGTADPYLSNAVDQLKQAGHNVIVAQDGFQDKAAYLSLVEQYRPKVIVLGMGMPKQELIAAYLKEHVTYNPLIINAGALIDFIGGKTKRAPRWVREVHMEWVFRLLSEPKRLFRRYVVGNAVFLSRFSSIRASYVPALNVPADLELEDLAG